MIRKKIAKNEIVIDQLRIVIDLTGPDGNAYVLLGIARRFYREMGRSTEEINQLIADMTSGNYENLIQVFDREFGDFVILER